MLIFPLKLWSRFTALFHTVQVVPIQSISRKFQKNLNDAFYVKLLCSEKGFFFFKKKNLLLRKNCQIRNLLSLSFWMGFALQMISRKNYSKYVLFWMIYSTCNWFHVKSWKSNDFYQFWCSKIGTLEYTGWFENNLQAHSISFSYLS